MKNQPSIYLNPLTDFGFKKIFGEEVNKEYLIDFLNALLEDEQGRIVELTYQNTEQLGISADERNVIYDLYCTNESGVQFIVELQRASQTYFIDRTVYYSSYLIQKQGKRKKNWNYELKAVYTIAILNFTMDKSLENKDKYSYKVKLIDVETQQIFYPKLTFIYLELPKFRKKAAQLHTPMDKWLYVFRNLETMESLPKNLNESIFMKLLETAKLENLPEIDRKNYQASLKRYRDTYSVLETAVNEGYVKGNKDGYVKGKDDGKLEEKYTLAKIAHEKGFSLSTISDLTGLTEEDIKSILNT